MLKNNLTGEISKCVDIKDRVCIQVKVSGRIEDINKLQQMITNKFTVDSFQGEGMINYRKFDKVKILSSYDKIAMKEEDQSAASSGDFEKGFSNREEYEGFYAKDIWDLLSDTSGSIGRSVK